jgi:pyridinium-3,5-biscarboxylic acid mononucleotide sulfurtransferase
MIGTGASKEGELTAWLRERGSVLVGYSGGVDSAYLACVAVEALGAERVLAVIGRSASYPAEQWATARRVAQGVGLRVEEVETDEVADPRYAANPVDRCYFCKEHLWGHLVPMARTRGIGVVIDGTNADDLLDDRAGARAAREFGVESPLAIVGLGKGEIRELSRLRGLPTWDQPSAPCLASRIPHGTAVTPERLRQVEVAEAALRAAGVRGDLRVRHHGEMARIEIGTDEMGRWRGADRQAVLVAAVLGAGYRRVAIDLAGFRSGSLHRAGVAGGPVGIARVLGGVRG